MQRPKAQADGTRSTGAALEAHYRFLPWLLPTVMHSSAWP